MALHLWSHILQLLQIINTKSNQLINYCKYIKTHVYLLLYIYVDANTFGLDLKNQGLYLYFSISMLCYFKLLLHYILDWNTLHIFALCCNLIWCSSTIFYLVLRKYLKLKNYNIKMLLYDALISSKILFNYTVILIKESLIITWTFVSLFVIIYCYWLVFV